MQFLKKVHLLQILLLLTVSFPTSISQETPIISYCGKLRIQSPFFVQNATYLSPLAHMLLCKDQKLYFRTSLGLFQVSAIDYTSKLLTVSHSFWSSTSRFISPTSLSAGFPHPPQPNSLVLFNCRSQKSLKSAYVSDCSSIHGYTGFSTKAHKKGLPKGLTSCLVIEDTGKLDVDFHPKEMNCTHYSRMYRNASVDDNNRGFELGTRISFDIPDHVPNPCNECKRPNGNCGIGLKCICHVKECCKHFYFLAPLHFLLQFLLFLFLSDCCIGGSVVDNVISVGVTLNPFGNRLFSFLCFIVVMGLFNIP